MTLTIDSPKLRELSRTQLQSLAKREFVRAIGKTEDIICRLMRKHPRGVPVPEDTENPSASSAPPKKIVLKIPRNGTPSVYLVPESPADHADPKGKGKAPAQAASPSPSSSAETLRLLYPDDELSVASPSLPNPESAPVPHPEVAKSGVLPNQTVLFFRELAPVPPLEHPPRQAHDETKDVHRGAALRDTSNPGWQASENSQLDDVYDDVDYPKGAPTHYMVVDALRKFTTFVNTIPSMETRVAESQCLLQRTKSLLEKAMPDARELAVTREYLETFLLAKMKQKPELWDGTAKMNKAARKLRMAWLRAERKAENEKRWRETNKLYEEKGLTPEPFSAFASQSDEEVIESLQTTPASSTSGRSKRPREESGDVDAGGESDADGESQKKRVRS